MFDKTLRCIHRHTVDEHPNCFVGGKLNEKDADKLAKQRGIPWFQLPEYRMGYIDIETTGLDADVSHILSWAIKLKGGRVVTDFITKKELFNDGDESRVIADLLNEMRKYKILVGYYSGSMHFDIPYIRTKALHYDLEFPEYSSIYHFDIYNTAKSKLKLSRCSLENVCAYLNIKGKTPLDRAIWMKARYGNPSAIAQVVEHNIADVVILEELHDKLVPFRKWTKTSL